jgi:pimeloyl-ACP methyl ester carboxylesterase
MTSKKLIQRLLIGSISLTSAALLLACGDSGINRGTLLNSTPTLIVSLTAAELTAELNASTSGQALLALAGTPVCGINVYYIQYETVGGASEATSASGALMVPTGSSSSCTGARPIVEYAHATSIYKNYNIANFTDSSNDANSESIVIATYYAAQGFTVVAPNYAGYDSSPLPYHPYLNADQQSKEMIDALTAARSAFSHLGVSDSGKLFLTGYSQGGHVAMATHRAMQNLGMTVTASAPMSGPYALAAFGDSIFYGQVGLEATLFSPLLTTSYQWAYGNIYNVTSDLYNPTYATGIDKLLPSTNPTAILQQGELPETQMFSSTTPSAAFASYTPPTTPAALANVFAQGFGTSALFNNSYRLSYLNDAVNSPDGAAPSVTTGLPATAPTNTLRKAFKINDLRNWTPTRPVQLCGGDNDPTVFYSVDTAVMQSYWSSPSQTAMSNGLLTVLDVDAASTGSSDPYATLKAGFAQAKQQVISAAVNGGATDDGQSAVQQAYHGKLVAPFCNAATLGFFKSILSSGI